MGKLYKHFKGGIYKKLVVYRSLKDNKVYARPYSMFFEDVTPGIKRFTPIKLKRKP